MTIVELSKHLWKLSRTGNSSIFRWTTPARNCLSNMVIIVSSVILSQRRSLLLKGVIVFCVQFVHIQ